MVAIKYGGLTGVNTQCNWFANVRQQAINRKGTAFIVSYGQVILPFYKFFYFGVAYVVVPNILIRAGAACGQYRNVPVCPTAALWCY